MRFSLFLLLILVAAGVYSCKKENKMSNIPEITFLSVVPNSVRSGNSEDSITISFKFKDGDADLGNDPNSPQFDIYMTDNRDSQPYNYHLPFIPEEIKDPAKGFEGIATVVVPAAFLILDTLHQEGDTFNFDIYMKDRAQNESNRITTPDIYLTP